jgi:hypothetical protein
VDRTAEQTVMCRTRLGEFSLVQFWRNGVYYAFPACLETLQDIKLRVAATADDPNQNLTNDDELAIIDALHGMIFTPERDVKELENRSSPYESRIIEPANICWVGFTLAASCVFWIAVGWVAYKVLN